MGSRVALVTGATDGIGKETALELARRGFQVIVHGRSRQKVDRVVEEIRKASGRNDVEGAVADFEKLDEVRAMAADVRARFPALHVLVNNAGVYMKERRETQEGHEVTFAVNHLAPFLLTNELLPLLKKSGHARIVNVSSMTHTGGELNFDDLMLTRGYSGYGAYSNSKLANVLFTLELAERLKGTDVTTNALHPGVVGTKLLRQGFGGFGGERPEEGARTSVMLASAPELEGVTGKYFSHGREAQMSAAARDADARRRLWTVSEQLVAKR